MAPRTTNLVDIELGNVPSKALGDNSSAYAKVAKEDTKVSVSDPVNSKVKAHDDSDEEESLDKPLPNFSVVLSLSRPEWPYLILAFFFMVSSGEKRARERTRESKSTVRVSRLCETHVYA